MNKYELITQISQVCDSAEELARENEMLKERLKEYEGCSSAPAASLELEAKFGRAAIEDDKKRLNKSLFETDCISSEYLSRYTTDYPDIMDNDNVETWLGRVERGSFYQTSILDDFPLSELKELFRPHLKAIYLNLKRDKEREKK